MYHLIFSDCFDDEKEYIMNIVVDEDGKNSSSTESEQECQKKCEVVSPCQFWTWTKEKKICEYKNVTEETRPTSIPNLQVISGPKFCSIYII